MNSFGILAGLRVVDLGFEKAAYCTKLLADLGAEVIKIEPLHGSTERKMPPFNVNSLDSESSIYFEFYNSNKKLVTLDINHPLGKIILRDLAAKSDVIVESFTPGYLEDIGLGYEALSEVNKSLIYLAITGFGQSGLHKNYKVTDLVAFAMGGLMQLSGSPDKPPVKAPGQQAYDMAALHGCIGVLMAVLEREQSGQGQFIDISMQEVMAVAEHQMAVYSKEERILKRVGSQHQVAVPGRVFRCKDGYVHFFIADASPKAWDAFLEWIGSPLELQARKWANGVYRRENVEYVDRIVEEFTARFSKNELASEAQKRHIPCVPVNTVSDLILDEHFKERRFFIEEGDQVSLRFPILFNEEETKEIKAELKLGAHNFEVFHEMLGYDENQLQVLANSGVV